MAKWIHIIESNCKVTSREAEFNDWYSNMHVPDILKCPVVVAARRYERHNAKEGEGKYLAIYEIETEDIDTSKRKRN